MTAGVVAVPSPQAVVTRGTRVLVARRVVAKALGAVGVTLFAVNAATILITGHDLLGTVLL